MRNKVIKRLRKLAVIRIGTESNMHKNSDGSFKWKGKIREYRNLKMQWKNSNIFEKGLLFND